jgi:hypothetical protein
VVGMLHDGTPCEGRCHKQCIEKRDLVGKWF